MRNDASFFVQRVNRSLTKYANNPRQFFFYDPAYWSLIFFLVACWYIYMAQFVAENWKKKNKINYTLGEHGKKNNQIIVIVKILPRLCMDFGNFLIVASSASRIWLFDRKRSKKTRKSEIFEKICVAAYEQ